MSQAKAAKAARILFFTILLIVVLLQAFTLANDYALTWLKRAWRNASLPSMERNALYLLGGKGSDYLEFIAASVPPDWPVVVPEGYGELSQQSILQFFLMPRGIPGCRCPDYLETGVASAACQACLLTPEYSIPAIGDFPPDDVVSPSKTFLPFDPNWYRGLYVPPGSPGNPGELFIEMDTPLIAALVLDAAVVALLLLLGMFLARTIDDTLDRLELLAVAIPIAVGTLTWLVFLQSWLGLAISVWMYAATGLGLALVLYAVRRYVLRSNARALPAADRFEIVAALRTRPLLVLLVGLALLLGATSLVISLNRGYSIFDGIANWALKGYGIALEKSVFAGSIWGGHALEYPQNIHIAIALFRLIDGDVVPGSKLLFPLFGMSLVAGCIALWRKAGVGKELALLGGLALGSIPILFIHSTIGWANLIFSSYIVLVVSQFTLGIRSDNDRKLLLAGFLLACAIWTRPEGIGYAAAFALLFLVALRVRGRISAGNLRWLLPVLLVATSWLGFSASSLQGGEIGSVISSFVKGFASGTMNLPGLQLILGYAYRQFTSLDTWGLVPNLTVFLLLLSLTRISAWKDSLPILTLLAAIVSLAIPLFMFFAASFSKNDMNTFLWASFDRAQFHGVVLLFSASMLAFGKLTGSADASPGSHPAHDPGLAGTGQIDA